MFAVLPKMVIDVIELGLAPIRVPTLGLQPVKRVRIAVGLQYGLGVRHHDIKNTARSKHAVGLSKKMWHLDEKLKVLEDVLAVYIRGAVGRERPILAEIQLKVGRTVETIDVDPAFFRIRAASQLQPDRLSLQKLPSFAGLTAVKTPISQLKEKTSS